MPVAQLALARINATAGTNSRSDCYAAAPTPDSLCPVLASVLPAASLHPSKEPVEQSKARSRIAASPRSASAASRRESLDFNASSPDINEHSHPAAPGPTQQTRDARHAR